VCVGETKMEQGKVQRHNLRLNDVVLGSCWCCDLEAVRLNWGLLELFGEVKRVKERKVNA